MTTPALQLLARHEVPIDSTSHHASRRLLVHIDGGSTILPSLLRRLRRLGCHVRTSRSAREFRAVCFSNEPELVVLPFGSGGHGAGDLLAWLAREHSAVPVLVVASSLTSHQVGYALEMGVVGIITEHSSIETFTRLVDRAWRERELRLAGRRAQREAEVRARRQEEAGALLDRALQELQVAWQPIEGVGTGRRDSWEALVRSPCLHESSALPLLELARELGRTREVDATVQQEVVRTLAERPRWRRAFVNVELGSLLDGSLAGAACPLRPVADRVVLDLPALDGVRDADAVAEQVSLLRGQGFGIATRDLGLWSSSATAGLVLRPDYVKLGVDELRQADRSPARRRYLEFMMDVAHRQRARVVVVGVSCERDRQLAVELGANLLQGYLLARPRALGRIPRQCASAPHTKGLS